MRHIGIRGVRRHYGITLAIAAFIVSGIMLAIAALIFGGAMSRQARSYPGIETPETPEELKAIRDMVRKHEELLRLYLKGDYSEAKLALEQIVTEIKKAAPGHPASAASLLYFTYGRLYLLEKRTGHDAAAQVNMVKLRYWWVRGGELQKWTPEEIVSNIDKYCSPEHIEKAIDTTDETYNTPHYREVLKRRESKQGLNETTRE